MTLKTRIAKLEKKLDIARKALDRYGQHDSYCGIGMGECTCGFEQAIKLTDIEQEQPE